MQIIFTIITYLQEFNSISIIIRLLLSVLLSGMIGMERSRSGQAAGLRTHILVCLGSAIASMTGLYINNAYNVSGDVTRIAAQVVSGIGFLGAGTILVKNDSTVTGLTTAACIWTVGAIGIAIGYGFYEAAILGTILMFFITKTLNILDKKLRYKMKETSVYIEFIDAKQLNTTLTFIKKLDLIIKSVHLVKPKTNLSCGVGANIIIHIEENTNADLIIEQINEVDNVNFAILTTK